MRLTCKEASRLISAGQDRDLGFAERTALLLHLTVCDACRKVKTQFEFIRKALAAYAKSDDHDKR